MKDDIYIAAPPIPAANTSAVWLDTSDGTFKDFEGLVGDLVFDQEVTVLIKTAPEPSGGGAPDFQVMNNGGDGDVIAANTPTEVRIAFLGPNTRVEIAIGDDVPSLWHVNGRVTKDSVG